MYVYMILLLLIYIHTYIHNKYIENQGIGLINQSTTT